MITYSINRFSESELHQFITENNHLFVDPTTGIGAFPDSYAHKVYTHAVRFEASDSKGHLIGLLCGYFNQYTRKVWLTYLCVKSGYQGNGIAQKLMEMAIEEAAEYESLGFESLTDNVIANNIYISLGFKAGEIIKGKIQFHMPMHTDDISLVAENQSVYLKKESKA